jgi:hypothetical protein
MEPAPAAARRGLDSHSSLNLRVTVSSAQLRTLHAWLTWLWLASTVPVLLTDLRNSVPLLVFISIYANVAGHFAAWQSARTEVKQDAA